MTDLTTPPLSMRFLIRRRVTGDAGPPDDLLGGELAHNEPEGVLYAGFGDDGTGQAVSAVAIAGVTMVNDTIDAAIEPINTSIATLESDVAALEDGSGLPLASQDEAEDGDAVNKVMTPERVKQSIAVELPITTADLPDSTDKRYVTDAQLSSISGGSFNGGYTYQTKALIDADTGPAINSMGYVVADATAAYNGTYQKTAAAGVAGWTKIGELPWATSVLSFQDPVIFDIEGLVTGSPVVFVPRQRYYWNGSSGALATNGTESATIAGYVEISVSATTQTIIYFDASDAVTPYKSAVYPSGMPSDSGGRYKIIAVIWSRHIHCPFNFDTTDNWNDGRLLFRTPPVVDGTKLYIPSFYRWFPNTSTSLTLMSPSDGSNYWALDISTSTTEERRHYFDLTAALAGATPVKTAIGTAVPRMGGGRIHLIATSMNGRVTPRNGYQIAGGGNGGVLDNGYDFALGNDPDITPYFFTGTTATTITDASLTALGFTRGFEATGTNRPYAGAAMKNPRLGYYFFGRAYYSSTVDDTFATARVYLRRGTTVIASGTFNMTLEQKLSARARIYSVSGQIPTTGDIPDNYIIGMENAAGSVTNVCGIQFAVSPEPAQWIARGDYATSTSPAAVVGTTTPTVLAEVTASSLLMGKDIWLTEGRPMPLFVQNMFSQRTEAQTVSAVLSSYGIGGTYPHVRTGNSEILLDPAYLGTTADFYVRHRTSLIDRRYRRALNVHIAPAISSGSPNILLIGNSLTNRGAGAWLDTRLAALGFTPTYTGSIIGQGTDGGDLTGTNGEGREGWKFADFTYEDTAFTPVAVGGEAAYLALSKANKRLVNPFIRVTTGGDDPAHVFNGYIFDLDFYLTRFGYADPDVVLIELGTNDFAQGSASQSLTWVTNGLAAMVASVRATLPSAHIGLIVHNMPRSSNGDAEWTERYAGIKEHVRYVAAAADSNLHIIPAWQHMSSEFGWGDTLVSTDTSTGTETRDWSDQIHFLEPQRRVVAELTASWVAARLNGL